MSDEKETSIDNNEEISGNQPKEQTPSEPANRVEGEEKQESEEPEQGSSESMEDEPDAEDDAENQVQEEPDPVEASALPARKIFVVACERDDVNQDCLKVLAEHNITPVIINHNPDDLRSIHEVIRVNPQVQFALIVLAGDDFCYDRLTGKPGEALLVAKSNSVFLLGYLLAKFGNLGTMTVYREQKSFHLPTGQHQTAFVPYQKGGAWEEVLESKLKQAKII